MVVRTIHILLLFYRMWYIIQPMSLYRANRFFLLNPTIERQNSALRSRWVTRSLHNCGRRGVRDMAATNYI